jgi:hypothetical protein
MKTSLGLLIFLISANAQAGPLSVTEVSFQEYGPTPGLISFQVTSGGVLTSASPDDLCVSSLLLDDEMTVIEQNLPRELVASFSGIAFSDYNCSHFNEYIVSVNTLEFGEFLFRWPVEKEGCGFSREIPDWVTRIGEILISFQPRVSDLCFGNNSK